MKSALETLVQVVSGICTFVLIMSYFRYRRCSDPKHTKGRSEAEVAREAKRYRISMLASVLICVVTLIIANALATGQ